MEGVEEVDLCVNVEDRPEVFAGVDPGAVGDGVRGGVVTASDGLGLDPQVGMPAGCPGL
ncbi:hypothetical protein KCH_23850 [Kitasatospora cheerisanensis KCTC 2395]|uniref:Uncharacterized protein n=1 Tax=Kitasatospora cheerisanensis KCTC 2395 TaxID=1348663 RepID=A0A066YWZ7_9ACTN|nr:hypothetical protein KCH_23850 [Kitasatospora cheerisanensis KCTC 2395]